MFDWMKKWTCGDMHKERRLKIFDAVYKHTGDVKKMVDIGCGLAREAEHYQKKCGTELWLLDGDVSYTKNNQREVGFGDVSSMKFYNPISRLKESFDSRGMSYTFVDAYNIDIPEDVKFDLFYSSKSCGFHYPASTYREFVKKHSHKNSMVIFDIQNDSNQDDFIVKNVVYEDEVARPRSKYLEIEFKHGVKDV